MRRILTAGFIAAAAISLAACSGWGSSGSSRNMPGAASNGDNLHAGQNQPAGILGEERSNGSPTGNHAGANTGFGGSAPDLNSGPNTQYQVH